MSIRCHRSIYNYSLFSAIREMDSERERNERERGDSIEYFTQSTTIIEEHAKMGVGSIIVAASVDLHDALYLHYPSLLSPSGTNLNP